MSLSLACLLTYSLPPLLTYLPTYLIPTYLLPTYLPTYLPTHLPTYLPTYLPRLVGSFFCGRMRASRVMRGHAPPGDFENYVV